MIGNIFESPLPSTGSDRVGFVQVHRGIIDAITKSVNGVRLTAVEIRVLLFIVEKTYGYQRDEVKMSIRQITRELGYSESTNKDVTAAVKNLEKLGLVDIGNEGNMCIFFIHIGGHYPPAGVNTPQRSGSIPCNPGGNTPQAENEDRGEYPPALGVITPQRRGSIPPKNTPYNIEYIIEILYNKYCNQHLNSMNYEKNTSESFINAHLSLFYEETKIKIQKKQNKDALLEIILNDSDKREDKNNFIMLVSNIVYYFSNSPRENNRYRYRHNETSIFKNLSVFQSYESIQDKIYHEKQNQVCNSSDTSSYASTERKNSNYGGGVGGGGKCSKQKSAVHSNGNGYNDTPEALRSKYLREKVSEN